MTIASTPLTGPSIRSPVVAEATDGRGRRDPWRRLHPARETASIASMREIKDGILRMGSLVEAAIRAAMDALVSP